MISFTTVVVTYANRGELLRRVVNSAVESGSNMVIIVDNGSEPASKEIINSMSTSAQGVHYHIIKNENNEGSAIAFYQGMDAAASDLNPNEVVLFLDDDNLAEEGSIQRAIETAVTHDNSSSVFFLLREDRPHYIDFINTRKDEILLGDDNAFMGFSSSKYIKKLSSKIFKKESVNSNNVTKNEGSENLIPIPCGPYGGMLTKKSILKEGRRPMKELVLYFDDTIYTYDLSKSGVNLFLLKDCLVKDIDDSWSAIKPAKNSSPLFEAGEFKLSHTIRNRIYFEMSITTKSKFKYMANISLFMSILLVKAVMTKNIKTYVRILKYIVNGFRFYNEKAR